MSDPSLKKDVLNDRISISLHAAMLEVCTRHSDLMIFREKHQTQINFSWKESSRNTVLTINIPSEIINIKNIYP
ncbi:hypothetical protein A0123_02915 [Gluconobacter cerinus]|uniref:Uncharacterized protein n=1 Tax=Gluconobacter cerinus TaxID=38307 RepID=A0A1B6VGQ5_9PROT|nr:hypothetical protein A0123_02915 [Gluconobacter cerinus]